MARKWTKAQWDEHVLTGGRKARKATHEFSLPEHDDMSGLESILTHTGVLHGIDPGRWKSDPVDWPRENVVRYPVRTARGMLSRAMWAEDTLPPPRASFETYELRHVPGEDKLELRVPGFADPITIPIAALQEVLLEDLLNGIA